MWHSTLVCGAGGQWHATEGTTSLVVSENIVLRCVEPRCDTTLGFYIEGVQCNNELNTHEVYHEFNLPYNEAQEFSFVEDGVRETFGVVPGPEGNVFNRTVNGTTYSFKVTMEGTWYCRVWVSEGGGCADLPRITSWYVV